jgi:predicted extracellular nuclease
MLKIVSVALASAGVVATANGECQLQQGMSIATPASLSALKLVGASSFEIAFFVEQGSTPAVNVTYRAAQAAKKGALSVASDSVTVDLSAQLTSAASRGASASVMALAALAASESPAAGALLAGLGMVACVSGDVACTNPSAVITLTLPAGRCASVLDKATQSVKISDCAAPTLAPSTAAPSTAAPSTEAPTVVVPTPTVPTPRPSTSTAAPTAAPTVPVGTTTIKAINANPTGTVTTSGVVTADLRATGRKGFFMQQTASSAASDATRAPEGLFVYCGTTCLAANAVAFGEGDLISITGAASRFTSAAEIKAPTPWVGNVQLTQFNLSATNVAALACPSKGFVLNAAAGNKACAAVNIPTLTLPVASLDDFLAYKGMLVQLGQAMFVTSTYGLNYGGLNISAGSVLRAETMTVSPGPQVAVQKEANMRRLLTIDDGDSTGCPSNSTWPLGGDAAVRVGHSFPVAALSGAAVLTYEFYSWTLVPARASLAALVSGIDRSTNPRISTPPLPANSLAAKRIRVGGFNMENYFTEFQDTCPTCRGALNAAEFVRQKTKLYNAIREMDGAILALQEVQNDGGKSLAAFIVDINAFVGVPGKYAAITTGTAGTDAITVALVYQPALVEPVGNFSMLTFTSPADKSRPSIAQTFRVKGVTGQDFTYVANHLKSKGSACDEDVAPFTGQMPGEGNCGMARLAHAQQLTGWLAAGSNPTGQANKDYIVVGDLNSHAKDRSIAYMVANGFISMADRDIPVPSSYSFDSASSTLDYMLTYGKTAAKCGQTYEWHINADESLIGGYTPTFGYTFPTACKAAKPASMFDIATPFRNSDHDPILAVCTFA